MQLINVIDSGMLYLDSPFMIRIGHNETHLVTGKNGQGKSTLIKLILGFIKPDFGVIERVAMKVGYAPELFELPKFIKTKHFLESIAKIKKDDTYLKLVSYFEIPIHKGIQTLSKGNLQKVNLVCAFMGTPNLIVLDEPLSGLDQEMQKKVIQLIKIYQKQEVSFLIATHQPTLFKRLATHTHAL